MHNALAAVLLTLAEAVRLASASHPAVEAGANEAAAAQAAVSESRAARLPSVTLGASALRYSEPMVATPIHGFSFTSLPPFEQTLVQSALTASTTLYDAGARSARIDEATRNADAASATVDTARQLVVARTATAYATVLGRAAILDAQLLRLRALEAERDRVQKFTDVGRAARVEMLRVEAAIAAAEAERVEAATTLDAAERALARLTGLASDATRAANLTEIHDNDALPGRDSSNAPWLRAARSRALAQHATIALARSARRPQLLASASELTFGTPRALLAGEWNAGLQLRFNVFDFGATGARIARASAAAKAADAQVSALELDNAIAVDAALAELEQSRAAAASLAKAVARFEEVARIEKLRLDNGAGAQTDYLRSEADLAAARASLAAMTYRIVIARVELARLAGELTPEWIEEEFR